MKKKSVFGKVGVLALVVLMLALGTGVVYGMWSSTVNINVASKTGTVTWALTGGVPYTSPTGASISDSISYTVINGVVINSVVTVTITSPSHSYIYYVPLTIQNTGTIPLKIQSITFARPSIG